jgi:TM2 domain-containing membrane protein YozV
MICSGVCRLLPILASLSWFASSRILTSALVSVQGGTSILLALFALDRFYFGQIGLGILKYLSLVIVIGLFWWLIDIFTAGGRADEFNRNKAREIAVSLRT